MKIRVKDLQNKIPISPRLITIISRIVLTSQKAGPNCELSILFVDDKFIKSLNKKYLETNRPTDVLAFPLDSPDRSKGKVRMLGDVVISTETVSKNAATFNNTPKRELIFCLIHGILHLLGYSDYTRTSQAEMFKIQERILRKLGLGNNGN